jgi:hypothetical protein
MSMFASDVTEMGEERYRRGRVIKSRNKVKIRQCLQAMCQTIYLCLKVNDRIQQDFPAAHNFTLER